MINWELELREFCICYCKIFWFIPFRNDIICSPNRITLVLPHLKGYRNIFKYFNDTYFYIYSTCIISIKFKRLNGDSEITIRTFCSSLLTWYKLSDFFNNYHCILLDHTSRLWHQDVLHFLLVCCFFSLTQVVNGAQFLNIACVSFLLVALIASVVPASTCLFNKYTSTCASLL